MQNVTSLRNVQAQYPAVNFKRADNQQNPYYNQGLPQDTLTLQQKQLQDEQKRRKRKDNFMTGAFIAMAGAAVVSVIMQVAAHKKMGKAELNEEFKNALKNIYEDLKGAVSLDEMVLAENLENTTNEIVNQLKLTGEILSRGGEGSRSLLLYGPPGTGKTTYAKAIAKELKAKFASIDMTKLSSKWVGETEKNLNAMIDKICADADAALEKYNQELAKVIGEDVVKSGNEKAIAEAIEKARASGKTIPDMEQFVVFCDEIDSVIMVDTGSGAKYSNDVLNEFKKMFTEKLGKRKNIITIGATNLEIDAAKAAAEGKSLDKPMLDRFASKVRVPNPDKRQVKTTIIKRYKDASLVDDRLKSDNPELDNLAKFMAEDKHNLSFRKLINIFNTTASRTAGSKNKVTINDIKQTLKEMKEDLNMTDAEIDLL